MFRVYSVLGFGDLGLQGWNPFFFFVFAVWSFLLLSPLKTSQADR